MEDEQCIAILAMMRYNAEVGARIADRPYEEDIRRCTEIARDFLIQGYTARGLDAPRLMRSAKAVRPT